ncbi:hypothetical protein [Streptomyces mirabilis]|uniref:hypothetical protein n=1 Tax=Streptomyces mirabilis TaxID=68239 RepID=UPI003660B078
MEQACPAGAEAVVGNTTVIADGGYRGTGLLIPNESLRLHGVQDELSDTSKDVCLGGIYALERIMRGSSKDQRSIVGLLSAYIRVHGAKVKADWSCGLFTNATMEEAYFPRPDLSDTKVSHVSIYDDGLSNANPFRTIAR